MECYPRVGLVLIRTEAYRAQEMQPALDGLRADTEEIANALRQLFDLQGPWIINSVETLPACQRALSELDLDMVVLACQTQASEELLAILLKAIGSRPLVIWCYLPWQRFPQPASCLELLRGSGPVGTFGALGILRNLGVTFFFTFGSPGDPRLILDLRRAGWAACLRHVLRRVALGCSPARITGCCRLLWMSSA